MRNTLDCLHRAVMCPFVLGHNAIIFQDGSPTFSFLYWRNPLAAERAVYRVALGERARKAMFYGNKPVPVPSQNGFVYVIESPSADDVLDGRTEGRALIEALRVAGISTWYSQVSNRATLLTALGSRLVEAVKAFNRVPTIHFSGHGNADGLALTNDEFLTWDELRDLFAPLNGLLPGGLLLCLSTCQASSGVRMAMYEDKDVPFWALVGNTEDTLWSNAAVAYITFYHRLFRGANVLEAVEAMRVASGDSNFVALSGQHAKDNWVAFQQKQRADALNAIFDAALAQHVASQADNAANPGAGIGLGAIGSSTPPGGIPLVGVLGTRVPASPSGDGTLF